MSEVIRVVVADDHAVVREGLRTLIAYAPGIEIVGEACDGAEAVELALQARPDVILMDLIMPRMSGIEAIAEIKAKRPDARILVLTSFSEDDQVFPAIKAGAAGYLLKDSSADDLIDAIRSIDRGESFLHPSIARKLISEMARPSQLPRTEDPLTARELDVLQAVARGLTNREIGVQLYLSDRTVSNYVSNILSKLHLANRVQATLYALRKGLVDLSEQ